MVNNLRSFERSELERKYIFRWYFSDTFLGGFYVLGVRGRLLRSRDWLFLSIYSV